MNTLYKCAVVVLILGVTATTGRAAISISVVASGDLDPGPVYDLTALGKTDWAVWTSSLTPAESKLGGDGIGALTLSAGSLGSAAASTSNPTFSWSDGDPTPVASPADPAFLISQDDIDATFSLVMDASAEASVAHLFVGVNRITATLTATLSDDPGSPVSAPEYSGGNFDHIVYRIEFSAGSAGQTLTLDWNFGSELNAASTNYLRYQAAALTVIPEPASAAMVLGAAAGLLVRRRRRA